MDNQSHSSIPQGLRNHENEFTAEPVEKDQSEEKSSVKSRAYSMRREDLDNADFSGDEQRFGGNLTHNGDDPDKVPVVPTLADDEVPNLPGAILRHAREMLGLSQREIALRLKLRVNTISDIEHDRLTQMTAAPFARGYIADYARLVNIDPKAVVDLYNQNVLETADFAKNQSKAAKKVSAASKEPAAEEKTQGHASNQQDSVSGKGRILKLSAVILALLLVIAAVWLFMSEDSDENAVSGTVTIAADGVHTEDAAASGELIVAGAPEDKTAANSSGYQDLLNAPAVESNQQAASGSETEELLISPGEPQAKAAGTSSTAVSGAADTSADKTELAVKPSPTAAAAGQADAVPAKEADAALQKQQEEERVRRAAEEKLKQEALQKEEAAKEKAVTEAPKLSAALSDISSAAKLRGREGLASLNNVSVSVKAPVSLQISDSRGKVLVSGSYKAGDRVSATGIPPLKVSVTDTSRVTVNYMGGTIVVPAAKQASFTLPNR